MTPRRLHHEIQNMRARLGPAFLWRAYIRQPIHFYRGRSQAVRWVLWLGPLEITCYAWCTC